MEISLWLELCLFFGLASVSVLISVLSLKDEVKEDSKSFSVNEPDDHTRDVLQGFGVLGLVLAVFCVIMEHWYPVVFLSYYAAIRFKFFNYWLNRARGLPRWYLSDRGTDKILNKLPRWLRESLEYLGLLIAAAASFYIFVNYGTL